MLVNTSVSCDLVPLPREGKVSQFWPECLEASDSAPLFGGVGLTPNSQNVERLGLGRAADPPRISTLAFRLRAALATSSTSQPSDSSDVDTTAPKTAIFSSTN